MGLELSHRELQELLGAYALGATGPEEREAVERHLEECPRCRAEVAEHLETAALLAGGGAAPEGLWDRIAASVGDAPVDLARARVRRRIRRSSARWLSAAAGMVLVLSMGLLGWKVIEQDRRLDAVAETAGRTGLYQAAVFALLESDSHRLELRSPVSDARVQAVVTSDGTGFLVADNLRSLTADRTYQLWAIVDGRAISAGVLGTNPQVTSFQVPPILQGLAITVERAGGVPITKNHPVVLGRVEQA